MEIQRIDAHTAPYFPQEVFYSPREQKEKRHDWCDAYFAAQGQSEEE